MSPLLSRVQPILCPLGDAQAPTLSQPGLGAAPSWPLPWGPQKAHPRPPHSHPPTIPSVSLPGCLGLSPRPDPLQAPGGRPPKPAWAHTVRGLSGKPELQRAGAGDWTCRFGSLGHPGGAPNRPLFSRLRAAGPSLHARSYSGADSSRRRAVSGGAAGR